MYQKHKKLGKNSHFGKNSRTLKSLVDKPPVVDEGCLLPFLQESLMMWKSRGGTKSMSIKKKTQRKKKFGKFSQYGKEFWNTDLNHALVNSIILLGITSKWFLLLKIRSISPVNISQNWVRDFDFFCFLFQGVVGVFSKFFFVNLESLVWDHSWLTRWAHQPQQCGDGSETWELLGPRAHQCWCHLSKDC